MSSRSLSVPLLQGPGGAADGVVNPFYSEKLQSELRLKALRPLELPRDDEGAQPVAAGRCGSAAQANGKGRGDGMVMFTTPSSWEEAGRYGTYGPLGRNQQNGLQSQGEMPREPGTRTSNHGCREATRPART